MTSSRLMIITGTLTLIIALAFWYCFSTFCHNLNYTLRLIPGSYFRTHLQTLGSLLPRKER
jgi:hypothetical protein